MGTKAVFSFSSKKGMYYTKIIGMTMDSSVENLKFLANESLLLAKENRCLTAFRNRDWQAISKVQKALVDKHKGWLFVDDSKNAEWVSYSAIFDPKTNELRLYYGMLEERLS